MPVYESICRECDKVHEYFRPVERCHVTPFCCGFQTEKVILSAPYGQVDIPAYQSPISGRWINSRRERNEDLKRNDCRPWEGMEQEQKEAARRAAYKEQADDAALEKTVVDAWQTLTPEKQAALSEAV
jgi:hypothetical protein